MEEYSVLRRVFRPKRLDETESWRELRNEELRDYVKENKMGKACTMEGERGN
jgi:hypothetical protein